MGIGILCVVVWVWMRWRNNLGALLRLRGASSAKRGFCEAEITCVRRASPKTGEARHRQWPVGVDKDMIR